ncbi:hypothetical protein W97_05522 [Coniosporium apollinis CBS 100218]|uniref:Uncharacterized protein n=1 Tax=Coniosporium apollinis (strain CBS 100218) TaxID=1168221 RepID=R7YWW6_CONA1|nr:uncharacterized protein W97_05522 [Coniosporium apollinis CBS 100218]EON66425.1 hypothetical protein W97_05522 [Coniosporium apollinis CBS 100218]
MTDPFSIAGSAVGVTSLGLTVCQGLIRYYTAYSAYDDDIAETVGLIRRLEGLFVLLRDVLQGLPAEQALLVTQVQSCMQSSEGRIKALDTHLDKCRATPSPGGSVKLQQSWRRGLFPFRKPVLNALRDNVESLRSNLVLAVEILQLALSGQQSSDLDRLLKAAASTANDTVELQRRLAATGTQVDDLQAEFAPVKSTILDIAPVIRNKLPRVEETGLRLLEKADTHTSVLEDVSCAVQSLHTGFNSRLPSIETKIDQLPDQIQERILVTFETCVQQLIHSRLMPSATSATSLEEVGRLESDMQETSRHLLQSPSFLKDTCDAVQRSNPDFMGRSSNTTLSSFGEPLCNCRAGVRSRNQKGLTRSITIFHSTEVTHRRDCPWFRTAKRTTTLGLSLPFSAYWLNKIVQFTMTVSKGAGALSISPALIFRATVPSDSPAFKLVDSLFYRGRRQLTCVDFKNTIRQLGRLFQEDGASPGDVEDVNGETLLTYALSACSSASMVERWERDVFESYREFLLELIRIGVPLDAVDSHGRSVLDNLFVSYTAPYWLTRADGEYDLSRIYSIANSLRDRGADWVNCHAWRGSPVDALHVADWLARFEDMAEVAQCGKLSTAILSRSSDEVRRLLRRFPAPLHERDALGFTPLHLAADQPELLALLLDSGFKAVLDTKDEFGYPPVFHASARNNLPALRLLLDADCALNVNILDTAIEDSWHDDVLHLLIDTLADRRKRLSEFTLEHLGSASQEQLWQLNLQSHTVLDRQAYDVCQALDVVGIPIPAAIKCSGLGTTVYHGRFNYHGREAFEEYLADKIYEAGFHDIDSPDCDGWTPLSYTLFGDLRRSLDTIRFVFWLLEKGASLTRRLPDCSGADVEEQSTVRPWTTAAHVIGSGLGRGLARHVNNRLVYRIENRAAVPGLYLGNDVERLLAIILRPSIFDTCRCACSTSGCSPAANLMNGFIIGLKLGSKLYIRPLRDFELSLTEMLVTAGGMDKKTSARVALELIRLKTFEELELTHTCCKGEIYYLRQSQPPMPDETEIDEIQEEQRIFIAQLEDLVAEFSFEFEKRQEPLLEFLDGYWTERMKEVLAEPYSSDEEAIRQIEELGVKIQRQTIGGTSAQTLPGSHD